MKFNGLEYDNDEIVFYNVVYVDFNYRQVDCPNCGHVIEELEFVVPYARVTTRLAEAVGQLKDEPKKQYPNSLKN